MPLRYQYLLILALAPLYMRAQLPAGIDGVSAEALNEKFYPADTVAPAAILLKTGKVYTSSYGPKVITEVFVRIKIYKKEGLRYAQENIPFLRFNVFGNVTVSGACTYNLVNGRIEKTPADEAGNYEQQISGPFYVKTIILPNVREGSIIEYNYKIEAPVITGIRDWYFQYQIPVKQISYQAYLPGFLTYTVHLRGRLPLRVEVPRPSVYTDSVPDLRYTRIAYHGSNIPALYEEPYIDNIDNYTAKLMVEVSAVQGYGEREEVSFSRDWPAISKHLYEDEMFGGQLSRAHSMRPILRELLKGIQDDRGKLDAIFYFVQQRMTWDEREGYLCRRGFKDAFTENKGNVADINLMFTAMLREAGFKANPVLLSTRENGKASYVSLEAYNYVIAAVETNSETLLLDATSKHNLPGVLPERALNGSGRLLLSGGGSLEIPLHTKYKSRETASLSAEISGDGRVSGKVRCQYSDNFAVRFREKYSETAQGDAGLKISKQYPGVLPENYIANNLTINKEPVSEEFSFDYLQGAEVAGDRIYFNPLLFLSKNENPFVQDKRNYPIDFVFPREIRHNVSVRIPAGYVVESIPAPAMLQIDPGVCRYRFSIEHAEGQIKILSVFTLDAAILPAEDYTSLKDFYKRMIEKQQEKVVLKKL